jgi:hypothetical protein
MARKMNRSKHRRVALRGLGAVVGEAVEYFLPASIVNALSDKQTVAFCSRDAESFISRLEYQNLLAKQKAASSKADAAFMADFLFRDKWDESEVDWIKKKAKGHERSAKTKEKAGNIIQQTITEIRKDIDAIRAEGIKGPIPMCVYRSSGRWLKDVEQRVAVPHERFHADSRRIEINAGIVPYACDANVSKVLGADLDPELIEFSRRHWASGDRAVAEEILARIEEVETACAGEGDDCSAVVDGISRWFRTHQKPELDDSFHHAMRVIAAKHGSPRDVMKAACRLAR